MVIVRRQHQYLEFRFYLKEKKTIYNHQVFVCVVVTVANLHVLYPTHALIFHASAVWKDNGRVQEDLI